MEEMMVSAAQMYKAVVEGGEEFISKNQSRLFFHITLNKDTALHIAARFGILRTARTILDCHPELLEKQNEDGDTPLHLAAKYGHLKLVLIFLREAKKGIDVEAEIEIGDIEKSFESGEVEKGSKSREVEKGSKSGDIEKGSKSGEVGKSSESGDIEKSSESGDVEKGSKSGDIKEESNDAVGDNTEVLPIRSLPLVSVLNKNSNSSIHEALKFRRESVAKLLINAADEEMSLLLEKGGVDGSLLYLAVLQGFKGIVDSLLKKIQPMSLKNHVGPDWKNVLHAAAIGDHPDIMKRLLAFIKFDNPTLITAVDLFNCTALHYAAANSSSVETTLALLHEEHTSTYVGDFNGYTPLFIAVINRKRHVVAAILDEYPGCILLNDKRGRNVLHIAVSDDSILKLLLRRRESQALVNAADESGNTPLHTAIIHERYICAEILMRFPGIDLGAANNSNQTPRDLCEISKTSSYRKGRIWKNLLRTQHNITYLTDSPPVPVSMTRKPEDLQRFAETLCVVATLLATVSCAATLAVPGGYKQSGTEEGLAVLARKAAFKVFLVADAVTMCTSLSAAFTLTCVMLGYHDLMREALPLCNRLLYISLAGLCLSFSTGTFVVVSGVDLCLAIITSTVGCVAWIVPLSFLMKVNPIKDSLVPMKDPSIPHVTKEESIKRA